MMLFVKRLSPNVITVGDVAMGEDGLWRVQQVHPFVRWVMV